MNAYDQLAKALVEYGDELKVQESEWLGSRESFWKWHNENRSPIEYDLEA